MTRGKGAQKGFLFENFTTFPKIPGGFLGPLVTCVGVGFLGGAGPPEGIFKLSNTQIFGGLKCFVLSLLKGDKGKKFSRFGNG